MTRPAPTWWRPANLPAWAIAVPGSFRWVGATTAPRRSLAAGLLLVSALACFPAPSPADIRVGATRGEVFATFGPPPRQQSLHKTSEVIWGPIESFWSEVPLGSTVEVWAYPVEGGEVELYFVDGSDRVQGTGFAPDGAVFEPGER